MDKEKFDVFCREAIKRLDNLFPSDTKLGPEEREAVVAALLRLAVGIVLLDETGKAPSGATLGTITRFLRDGIPNIYHSLNAERN